MCNKKNKAYHNRKIYFRVSLTRLVVAPLILQFVLVAYGHADIYFNPALLEHGAPEQEAIDLSVFEEKGRQLPGNYHVDIYLNNNMVDTRNLDFRLMPDSSGNEKLYPCIPVSDLDKWGVIVSKYPALEVNDSNCADLRSIPQADSNFNFSQQKLLLSFPQSSIKNAVRGWVNPELWDEGISAFLLNYSINGANNYTRNGLDDDSHSLYMNLRPGINIGAWRLRNYTTWNKTNYNVGNGETTSNWDTIYTYAQRNIISLKGQLTIGDSNTSSDVFDSLSFRGVQLASDDDMLPESQRGYAPVVRGIARTNAQVTIRQNGYIIYQTYVSPGSFEISDMYPTGGGGNLYVTIKESDGSEQQLIVPYASLPVLQREGRLKYSFTSGVYRTYSSNVDSSPVTQATAIYGLPYGFTLYGGGQLSNHYQSFAFGQGKNLGDFGAVSVDMIQAWSTRKNEEKESGQSWRIRYSKNFSETGTNFAIAGYRYATNGFWSMQEVLDTYRTDDNIYFTQERRRNRAELTMNQSLWKDWGNLALTAVREDYWDSDRRTESYGLSYNNSYNNISYSVNYTYNRNSIDRYNSGSGNKRTYERDQLLSVSVSVPLDNLFNNHSTYVNYAMNTSKKGNTTNSVNIGGTLLERDNLSWNVQEGYGSQGEGNTTGVNADWRTTYGEINGGYSRDKYNQRINYGLQGGIVAHKNGITLGQPMGETIALIAAPGADGVAVQNQTGVRTDFRGYTIVPYVSPYRKNDLTLDPQTLKNDTELMLTTQTVIPTRGAVVEAHYKASVGYRVLMELLRSDGQTVPFGAVVTDSGLQAFIVGDGGQVYLTGLESQGQLLVKWGHSANEQCRVDYKLPENNTNGIVNMIGQCH